MTDSPDKPRMVFFMPPMDNYPPARLGFILHQMVRGLSEFFELVVVSEECDYAEVCDTYRPDITMFDSGHELLPCRVRVTNTSAFPDIPKIGYIRSDAFSHNRTIFLSDMDEWGVETFFTCDTAMAEYTPEMAEHLFYWPHFIDTEVYRDYGQDKSIHVLFVGNCDGPALEYQWRIKVKERVTQRVPSLVVPHPGYNRDSPVIRVYGEQYARLINSSLVVPTCGAMSKVVVKKHLEIPAARACLVTERTPAVEAFGFADMVNCVFADEHDVVDKLKYLFDNRDVLERITDAGFELAHTRHTVRQRPQIVQWLRLRQSLKPGQRIVQTGLLDDLQVVDEREEAGACHIINHTVDRTLLRQGDEKLAEGRIGEAKLLYRRCFDYVEWMPEPKLRLALCALREGDTDEAFDWISRLVEPTLGKYGARTPDPVEWAWFLITLLCRGEVEVAARFVDYFPDLRHRELDRARWAVYVLAGREAEARRALGGADGPAAQARRRKSIHQLPRISFGEYARQVCSLLRACKQRRLARVLSAAAGAAAPAAAGEAGQAPGSPFDAVAGHVGRDAIAHVLEFIERERAKRRPRLSDKLKRRVPDAALTFNKFISQYPVAKAKIRALALSHLKIQDW